MTNRSFGPAALLALALSAAAHAGPSAGFTVLHDFTGPEGALPQGSPVVNAKGVVSGTTTAGGIGFDAAVFGSGAGTAFQIDPAGTLSLLTRFDGTYGRAPEAGLAADNLGNLYGTALGGGPNNFGTLYRLDAGGGVTVLHSFYGHDGALPFGNVTLDGSGRLFGTTFYGGSTWDYSAHGNLGSGAIFRQDPDGGYHVMHSFDGPNGGGPLGTLVLYRGHLWGTTVYGSAGVIFRLNPNGTNQQNSGFAVVHSLGSADGINAIGGLVGDHAGNLYGVATNGGPSNAGTIYKIVAATGAFSVVYSFSGPDGAFPIGTLARDAQGMLYGVTKGNSTFGQPGAGLGGQGTVFQFDPATGVLTTLHTFSGGDGANPFSGPVIGPGGALYGTTEFGGANNLGTVYRLE